VQRGDPYRPRVATWSPAQRRSAPEKKNPAPPASSAGALAATPLLLLVLARGVAAAPPDEFTDQLARLGAAHAAERAAAERWLEAHLALERYPDVAGAARAGDAEVRARLVRVLSSDPRHLPLALALSAEKDAGPAAPGRDAVRRIALRPDLGQPAERDVDELLRHAASASPPRSLVLDAHLPLEQWVEELQLVGELPMGLTLDARVATKVLRREEDLPGGPWNELLVHAAHELGVGLEIHGLPPGRDSAGGAFLRFTADAAPVVTGVDLIGEWLFTLAKEGDEGARARAACNLASAGFARR
jgi:hypothetical protein